MTRARPYEHFLPPLRPLNSQCRERRALLLEKEAAQERLESLIDSDDAELRREKRRNSRQSTVGPGGGGRGKG